jgi:hypothetical protein
LGSGLAAVSTAQVLSLSSPLSPSPFITVANRVPQFISHRGYDGTGS